MSTVESDFERHPGDAADLFRVLGSVIMLAIFGGAFFLFLHIVVRVSHLIFEIFGL